MSDQTPDENSESLDTKIEKKGEASTPRPGFFKKLMDWVNAKFSNVFSASHWIFTVIFFGGAVFLAILQFFVNHSDSSSPLKVLQVGLFAATSLILAFLFLFVFSSINKTLPFILEGKLLRRLIMFIVFFAISFALCIILFIESDNLPTKYHYDQILPVIYILAFFGWNAVQIYFIAKGMEGISTKAEDMIFRKDISNEDTLKRGKIWLIVCIVIPFGMQVAILALLFTNNLGTQAMINDAIGQVIFGAWFIIIILVLVAASLNGWRLYKQTVKHDTPSLFSSFMHMLFLVYMLYRSYQFINSVGKVIESPTTSMPISDQVIDTILLVLALLLLFQGLGTKLGKVSVFNKNNVPFFAYLLATVVIMGQVAILITVPLPPPFVSALNNLMMMSVSIIYYFVYLKRKLMQEDYLERDTFSAYEIQGMFNEYTSMLLGSYKNLDSEKVNDQLKQFLLSKEIVVTREPTPAPPAIATQAPAPMEEKDVKEGTPAQEEKVEDQEEPSNTDSPADKDDEEKAENSDDDTKDE